jgi:hypothetical protein
MFLPIDTGGMAFTVNDEPRPVLDFESKTPRATSNGEPLWSLRLYAKGALRSVITVKVAGEPPAVAVDQEVTVTGLTGIFWELDGRKGLSFRAERIEPAAALRHAAS